MKLHLEKLVNFFASQRVDLSGFVEPDDASKIVVGILDTLPFSEAIATGASESSKSTVDLHLLNEDGYDATTITHDARTWTIVECRNYKKCDIATDSGFDWLFARTTFGCMYEVIRERWAALLKIVGDRHEPAVLSIPTRMVLDENRKPLEKPILFNVLIVAVPNKKSYEGGIDTAEFFKRTANKTLESAIVSGNKNLLLNPYGMGSMQTDCYLAAKAWWDATHSNPKVDVNIPHIRFVLANTGFYDVFSESIR